MSRRLVVTAPDAIAAAVRDVVIAARDGTGLQAPAVRPLPTETVGRLARELGDLPRLALNALVNDPKGIDRHGANRALAVEVQRRSTRRALAAWGRTTGTCTAIEPTSATDYGWTTVITYRVWFDRGDKRVLAVHLDDTGLIADLEIRAA